jgi:hypothetical protein
VSEAQLLVVTVAVIVGLVVILAVGAWRLPARFDERLRALPYMGRNNNVGRSADVLDRRSVMASEYRRCICTARQRAEGHRCDCPIRRAAQVRRRRPLGRVD